MNYPHDLQARVRAFMAANNLSRAAFARHAGVSRPTLSSYLDTTNYSQGGTVQRIAEAITRDPSGKAVES